MSTATVSSAPAVELSESNPFAQASTLPFLAPPFDRIRDEDFAPAIEAGMATQRAEVEAIAGDAASPTFANTLAALERSGALLDRTLRAMGALTSANTNATLQAVQQEFAPRLAAHGDSITLNPALFARVDALFQGRDALGLEAEELRLLEITHQGFVHAGARLGSAEQDRLRGLNEEESTLTTAFRMKLLAANKAGALPVEAAAALDGLSPAQVAAAENAAELRGLPGYLVALHNTTQQPAFTSLTQGETRRALFARALGRTEQGDENDTRALIARLAQLRAQKAALLGFSSYAAWKLDDQMAQTPAKVREFLVALAPKAHAAAAAEAEELERYVGGESAGLQPWDWEYVAEQVRRERFQFDEDAIKPYFELRSVLERGVFYAATLLFGLRFTERHDLPVYHPTMRVFEVQEEDGAALALLYLDLFKRDNKSGGAWMSSFVGQSRLLGTLPVVVNVSNITAPVADEPVLLTFDEVITLFHEFGHGLHGMLSAAEFPSLAGTAVPRDFVEFPSQFNEHWATDPAVFSNYARHHQTGESMPDELREKLLGSREFNEGFRRTELLAAAQLDQQWHTLAADAAPEDTAVFEEQALVTTGMAHPLIPPRYRSTYFAHIWGGGYAAAYYAYLWAESLELRAIAWFAEHGGLTRANGERLREMILSRGNTRELQGLFEDWAGAPHGVVAGDSLPVADSMA